MNYSSYLLFELSSSLYAIDATFVQEIVELPQLKRLPQMPFYLAGFLNLHGEIIHVLDLSACLGLSPTSHSLDNFIIVIRGNHHFFGLIVRNILNVEKLSSLIPLNLHLAEEEHPALLLASQIAKFQEQMIFILEPDSFMKRIETLYGKSIPQLALEASSEYEGINAEDQSTFILRAKHLMEPIIDEHSHDSLISLIVVMLGDNYFGIQPEEIKEFVPVREFTPIPHAPLHLLGCLNVKGNALTLLDISPLLNQHTFKITPSSQALIVDIKHEIAGIAVNQVVDLIQLTPNDLHSISLKIEDSASHKLTKHIVFYKKNILTVLDIPNILEVIIKASSNNGRDSNRRTTC